MVNKQQVLALIKELTQLEPDATLLGNMDSLDLVQFLVTLEYEINKRSGKDIVIQSRAAFSRERSPFRDVDSLAEFIVELLE